MTETPVVVEIWDESHPRWDELMTCVEALDQTRWATVAYPRMHGSAMLVALQHGQVTGFLRIIVQDIGAEDDHAPVTFNGRTLTEAKVLAFGVLPEHRNQGIGRALQEATLRHARELGCYQVRSHSSGENTANHHLKLSMGFALHPVVRGDDRGGVYFVKTLDDQ